MKILSFINLETYTIRVKGVFLDTITLQCSVQFYVVTVLHRSKNNSRITAEGKIKNSLFSPVAKKEKKNI